MNIDSATATGLFFFGLACVPFFFAARKLGSAANARYIGQEDDLSAEEKTEKLGDCISYLAEGILLLFLATLALMIGALNIYTGAITDLIRAATAK